MARPTLTPASAPNSFPHCLCRNFDSNFRHFFHWYGDTCFSYFLGYTFNGNIFTSTLCEDLTKFYLYVRVASHGRLTDPLNQPPLDLQVVIVTVSPLLLPSIPPLLWSHSSRPAQPSLDLNANSYIYDCPTLKLKAVGGRQSEEGNLRRLSPLPCLSFLSVCYPN